MKDAWSLLFPKVGACNCTELSDLGYSLFISGGSLRQAALRLLEAADIQICRESSSGVALAKDLPLALIFLSTSEIPAFVYDGHADIGITRSDQVLAHDATVKAKPGNEGAGSAVMIQLDFGVSKLQLQVPRESRYDCPSDLLGCTVATCFGDLTYKYFARLDANESLKTNSLGLETCKTLRTKIIKLRGSAEAACAVGIADGIVDRVGKHA